MTTHNDKILMCPPDFFTVECVINLWMAGHETSLDIDLAKRQWNNLKDAISEVAEVVTMEPHFKKWFSDDDFDLLDLDEKLGFEGAGDKTGRANSRLVG